MVSYPNRAITYSVAMEDQIDQIKQRISIVDVVSGYVPLKQTGRNFKALCPFHQEKTPSFTVNPDLGLYKCFGCGEAGDIFAFVMKMEHCDFKEALETLAQKAGVELRKTTPKTREKRGKKEQGYRLNADVAQAYHKLLLSSQGVNAKKYLTSRGVSDESIQRFCLGFAPPLWDTIASKLSPSLIALAVELGILIEKSGKFYDRYRGRIIFPVYDSQGRCVGFSARLLDEYSDPHVQQGKYINSPQSFLFDKSSTLYGLHLAKDVIFEDSATLVEGNLDVVLLHQHGIKSAVAPLGTAVTKQHITMLKKYSSSLILSLDGDDAGRKALLRTLELCVSEEIIPEVVPLPMEEDPASLLAKGVFWKSLLEGKIDGYRYYLAQHTKKAKKHSPAERQRTLKVCLRFLRSIRSSPIQEFYRKVLADLVGVSEASIAQDLSLLAEPAVIWEQDSATEDNQEEVYSSDEIIFFNYLLQHSDALALFKGNITPADFSSSISSELFEAISKNLPLTDLLSQVSEECRIFTEMVLFTPEITIDNTTLLTMATSIKEKSLTRQLMQMKRDLDEVEDPISASLLLQSMVELKKVLESLKSRGIAEYGSS